MTIEKRKQLVQELFSKSLAILHSKGESYAGTEDTLSNFKRNAANLGMTKYQVWAVYFGKHIDSINNAIKANPENPIEKTEGLDGRILDAITYLSILYCLQDEDGGIDPANVACPARVFPTNMTNEC